MAGLKIRPTFSNACSCSGLNRLAIETGQPAMSQIEEAVFAEALEKQNAQKRAAFLDRACADDLALRLNVESLLSAYDAGQFLETAASAILAWDEAFRIGPGTVIGPYKLLEQLGSLEVRLRAVARILAALHHVSG
jgi:hypothetical protein